MTETYLIRSASGARLVLVRLAQRAAQLMFSPNRMYRITLESVEEKRSTDQNAKIRAIEGDIAAFTGEDPGRLHEILLARRFGTERVDLGAGKFMERPAKRTADMTKGEAADYITWLQAFAATDLGLELV